MSRPSASGLLYDGRFGKEWTGKELALLSKHRGNYDKLQAVLPGRSRGAIYEKSRKQKLTAPNHIWTDSEKLFLRRLYRKHDLKSLSKFFPFTSYDVVAYEARRLGLYKPRRPYKRTHQRSYDALRKRCLELHYFLADLDYIVRRPGYFSGTSTRKKNPAIVRRAIEALDGTVSPFGKVTWHDG